MYIKDKILSMNTSRRITQEGERRKYTQFGGMDSSEGDLISSQVAHCEDGGGKGGGVRPAYFNFLCLSCSKGQLSLERVGGCALNDRLPVLQSWLNARSGTHVEWNWYLTDPV